MKKQKPMGLILNGSLRSAGVTFYLKEGQMIVRSSRSQEPRSNTRAQFVTRQRMRHITAPWQTFGSCRPMFAGNGYYRFKSLATALPVVYIPRRGPLAGASFLIDGMPVSEGTLAPVAQRIGLANDRSALLTGLAPSDVGPHETLLLYTAGQRIEEGSPRLRFQPVRHLTAADFDEVEGHLALTGDAFADPILGWALVRMLGDRCSTQHLVSRCTLWQQYATEEALQEAARSYGGLTGRT